MTKLVAVDIGRCWTKWVCGRHRGMDLSVLGEKSKTSYRGIAQAEVSLNGTAVHVEHPEVGSITQEVGNAALAHSGIRWSPRSRDQSDAELVMLLSHTLRELNVWGDIALCVGTPARFYDRDKDRLAELFTREWYVNNQKVNVVATHVMPQPAGAAWHLAVTQQGDPRDVTLLQGKVGIIDGGEYSTDGGVLDGMDWQGARVVTIESGVSAIKRAVADYLTDLGHPKLPYEVDTALRERGIRLQKRWVDLTAVIEDAADLLTSTILSEFGDSWRDRDEYSHIIVEGGAAYYVGELIQSRWGANVEVTLGTPGPEWWNVMGFYAYLQYRRKADMR